MTTSALGLFRRSLGSLAQSARVGSRLTNTHLTRTHTHTPRTALRLPAPHTQAHTLTRTHIHTDARARVPLPTYSAQQYRRFHFSTSWLARLPTAKAKPNAEAYSHIFNENITSFQLFIKPFVVASGVTLAAFTCAAVAEHYALPPQVQYMKERMESMRAQSMLDGHYTVESTWEELKLIWKAEFNDSERFMLKVIALNIGVFLLWKAAPSVTARYFLHSPYSGKGLQMILSHVSHKEVWHLAMNMIAGYSFGTALYYKLGVEQLLFVSTAGAMMSSLANHIFALVTKNPRPGLGMSGIIMALLAIQAWSSPESRFQIIFLPFFTFSALNGLAAIMAVDALGLILGWKTFGHAAHLGGSLFGIWYAEYGRHYWENREDYVVEVVKILQKLRLLE